MQVLKRFGYCDEDSYTQVVCRDTSNQPQSWFTKKCLVLSAVILSLVILLLPLKEYCDNSAGKSAFVRVLCTFHRALHNIVTETKYYVLTLLMIMWDFIKDILNFVKNEFRRILPAGFVSKSGTPIPRCPNCVPPKPKPPVTPAPLEIDSTKCDCT